MKNVLNLQIFSKLYELWWTRDGNTYKNGRTRKVFGRGAVLDDVDGYRRESTRHYANRNGTALSAIRAAAIALQSAVVDSVVDLARYIR